MVRILRSAVVITMIIVIAGCTNLNPYPRITSQGKLVFSTGYYGLIIKNYADDTVMSVKPPKNCGYNYPSWNPKATLIAATLYCPDENHSTLVILDFQGQQQWDFVTGLEDKFAVISYPAWSPDGSRMAFMTRYQDKTQRIWMISTNTNGNPLGIAQPVTGIGVYGWQSWNPTKGTLVFSGYNPDTETQDIYEYDPATGITKPLVVTTGYDEWEVSFSPVGSTLVYSASEKGHTGETSIFFRNLVDGRSYKIIDGMNSHPSWSPDGYLIAYSDSSGVECYEAKAKQNVYAGPGTSPAWAPQNINPDNK